MKKLLILLFLFCAFQSDAQRVIPIVDFNNYFRSFQDGFFRQITMQQIRSLKYGDNIAAYIDFRSNLVVYDGKDIQTLCNVETVTFEVSDFLLTWQLGETLNMWDDGDKRTLSYRVGDYALRDSLIVFTDTRFNSVSTYYNGEVYELYRTVETPVMPDFIGENIIAYKDNGNYYKVFWRGKVYELDVWHDSYPFEGGTDMIAFNDPMNGTFAIFENGQFLDVEMFHMEGYKVGNKFVVYENRNGDLMMYSGGNISKLTNFGATSWDVKDNVVYWTENGFTYAYVDGKKYEVARYIPEEYAIKNSVIAFRNIMGGVSALQDGKVHEITNQMEAQFTLHGNSVLVELFNKSFIVLQAGRKYTL